MRVLTAVKAAPVSYKTWNSKFPTPTETIKSSDFNWKHTQSISLVEVLLSSFWLAQIARLLIKFHSLTWSGTNDRFEKFGWCLSQTLVTGIESSSLLRHPQEINDQPLLSPLHFFLSWATWKAWGSISIDCSFVHVITSFSHVANAFDDSYPFLNWLSIGLACNSNG